MLDYHRILALPPLVSEHRLTRRDTILYALGVGAGDLRHVYEEGLEALPTMAAVLAYPGFFAQRPDYGLDWRKVLHLGQSIELLRPLPVEGLFRGETRIEAVYDKGVDKGALIQTVRTIRDAQGGDLVAISRSTSLARGDGGFGVRGAPPPPPATAPDRAPDHVVVMETRPDQALLYRLSGDYNPLHVDPAVAREAGFDRPILHGLCTFGVVGRALLSQICANDTGRVRRMNARFSRPIVPGESMAVEIWRESGTRAAFRAVACSDGRLVLSHGRLDHG